MFFPLYGTVLIFFSTAAQSSPEVHLTADPPWTAMFPREKVTLTCQVIGSQGWMFSWIRLSRSGGTTQIQGFGTDNSVLVLDSAAERHSGQYHCEAERLNERVVSNVHSITVSAAPPQAVIVTDPPASEVFAGETVSLACIIEGSGWRYSWSRITQQRLESLSARSTDSQQKHVIDSVRESDGGTFLCQGERGQNPVIQSLPGSLVLNVSGGKPKPMITQNPHADTLYTGERVTLSCGFGGDSASWEYLWYRDTMKAALPNTDRSGVSYTIRSAALDHSGEYRCRAARGTKPFYSQYSHPLTLHIADLPHAHLSVQSGWTEVFSTETVTLKCVIEDSSTDWMYKWYRNGEELRVDRADFSSETRDAYTILSADQSHNGSYSCRGELKIRATVHSMMSISVPLRVQGERPKPTITQNPLTEARYIGERVTLSCGFGGDSASWEYLWFKDSLEAAPPNTDRSGVSYTIRSAALDHSGKYRCRAARGTKPFYSDFSDPLTLHISGLPRAHLIVHPAWTEVFSTETVTLKCVIYVSFTDWMYKWYREGKELPVSEADFSSETGDTYTIQSADQSHTGSYSCRGELKMRATVHSMISKSVPLRVQGERPKPTITQNPLTGQLYIGEIVTLSCGFGGDSASWKYLWYRDTMEAALPNTDRSGVSYTIRSAALDLSGEYRCRAARGTKPFYSDYSDPLTLQISDLPRANLSVQSGWTAVFPTETVTLKCVIEDSSTDWIYKWYRGRQELPVGEADFSSETGDTYTILSADQSHTGLYSCRGELKRRAVQSTVSNTVKLNILPVPKANLTVQTGWTEIFPRETVTLKCVIEDSSTDWIYKWYRGGEELAVEEADFSSETGETYTILSAEQSHSGLYRCRGELTMRPTVHSLDSSFVTLSVQAQLQAVLALNVGWVEIFTIIMQGSLRMRCELQGSSANWNYIWYRNRTKISLNHTGQSHTVGFWDSFSHEEYACQGNRTDGRYCSLISDGFTPANTRPYVILGLSGCVIIFITMVVLAVKCYKKRKIAGENQVDGGEFYSRVNADYIRTDRGLLNQAVYEEINPTTETEGSEVAAGQLNFYSVVQLKPLNQGSEAATGQLSFYSAVQLKPQNQGELSTE